MPNSNCRCALPPRTRPKTLHSCLLDACWQIRGRNCTGTAPSQGTIPQPGNPLSCTTASSDLRSNRESFPACTVIPAPLPLPPLSSLGPNFSQFYYITLTGTVQAPPLLQPQLHHLM